MLRILAGLTVGLAMWIAGPRAMAAQADHLDAEEESAAQLAAGGHGGGHEHIGAVGASTDPSEFKGDLAIYTVIVFLLLLAILYKFAWGPISHGLEKREHGIVEHIAAAARQNEEAKELLAEYERKLAKAQEEVRAILDEARRDAQHTQQEILAQARTDAAAEMARAKREVEIARDEALKRLAETGANLAVDLAAKVLRRNLNAADHAQLIAEAVAQFPHDGPSRN